MHFPLDALALAALGSPLPLRAAGRSENSPYSPGRQSEVMLGKGAAGFTPQHGFWWRWCSAQRLMGNTEEGMKKTQGSRPCTVLSFLQVLFNSRKEASSFWRAVCCEADC